MSDIKWPDGLPGPLVESYARDEVIGFRESQVAAGPSYVEPYSDDTPIFHTVTYQFKAGDARRFQLWLRQHKFKFLSPVFDGPIVNEDNKVKFVECRYTADGYPQLLSQSLSGICVYQARMITRKIENLDDELPDIFETMWGVDNGNVDADISLLDEGLNL